MHKKLTELSLEELWRRFPIVLTPHAPCWAAWYRDEERALAACLPPERVARVSHIGSTAIPSIWAKPIVDILVEAWPDRSLEELQGPLENAGYLCMSRQADRISFNKGYLETGYAERVFHLHLRYAGDNDELYFRDYLLAHPQDARAYEACKLALWRRCEHNRDAYTENKTGIVRELTQKARTLYGDRYRVPASLERSVTPCHPTAKST